MRVAECQLTVDGTTVVVHMNDGTTRAVTRERGAFRMGPEIIGAHVELRYLSPTEIAGLNTVLNWGPRQLPEQVTQIGGRQEWRPHPSLNTDGDCACLMNVEAVDDHNPTKTVKIAIAILTDGHIIRPVGVLEGEPIQSINAIHRRSGVWHHSSFSVGRVVYLPQGTTPDLDDIIEAYNKQAEKCGITTEMPHVHKDRLRRVTEDERRALKGLTDIPELTNSGWSKNLW